MALVQKIGENMSIRRFVRFDATGALASYVHGVADRRARSTSPAATTRSARISRCTSRRRSRWPSTRPACRADGRRATDREDRAPRTPPSRGKPANIVDKMVEGRVNKFLAEVTLLGAAVRQESTTADGREADLKAQGATRERVHAVRRRRRHREEEGRLRRGSRGDGEGLTAVARPARGRRSRARAAQSRHERASSAPMTAEPLRGARMNPPTAASATPIASAAHAAAKPAAGPAYKRILLKLSGEALMGDDSLRHRARDDRPHRRGDRRRAARSASRSRSSSAAATSSAASRPARPAWTARRPTTWACSRR